MNHLHFVWQCITFFFILPLWGTPEEILQEAHTSYQQGEKTETYEERKIAFNRALFLYSSLEQEPHPATLDQAIADTYFQLEQYPWAILYYQRALKKNPNHPFTLSRLEKAQKKLGLPPSPPPDQPQWIQPFISLLKQFQLLFWAILLTFLAFSCAIWLPFPWIRIFAVSCASLLALLLANFLLFYYLTPLEGILVKTTGFYRAPNWNQPQLTNQPLLAGSKVQILQMTPDEEWLKIETTTGMIGYIPMTHLRLI